MGSKATSDTPWLEVHPHDYYFGTGVLRIHVTRPLGEQLIHGRRFIAVEGMEYAWNGQPMGERRAYIRPSVLATAGVKFQRHTAGGG